MVSFKDIPNDLEISSLYEGGIKVLVESNDDLVILRDKWFFNHKDKLCFESVSDEEGSSGGCQEVIAKVKRYRRAHTTAFGIVDRDVLLSDEDHRDDLWWETDDEKFRASTPYGNQIFILSRWEIENYLLKPLAIKAFVKDKLCSPAAPQLETSDFLGQADDLIVITSLSTIASAKSNSAPKPKWGLDKSGAELKNLIATELNVSIDEVEEHFEKIKTFATTHNDDEWDGLTRLLDGKRIFHRLNIYLKEKFTLRTLDLLEEKGVLAGYVNSYDQIDKELKQMVDGFLASH
ncbi:hypothetical protein UWK_00652 [Desulfocapsa sulfexigens DSM 10523]|uniref:DUF4435 domain-containing protein n=1 Tax=Desulfocapsa sulfexigens (strain DSM 10523 / SB164P1) TaxID=1167006 RepID=M1P126_DESSD|nr:DUF4435 domain-containing protein [Desulfocapsa sulfexigens]AGF77233.1 hypothetical protein UWK_00652 [Desulfocapsa sulfexigens DSM 10523]